MAEKFQQFYGDPKTTFSDERTRQISSFLRYNDDDEEKNEGKGICGHDLFKGSQRSLLK